MNRVYTPSTYHPLRSPPMLPSGPTHCYPDHYAHCVRYHKATLSTVWSKAVYATQHVFCPERSTAQDKHEHTGAQTCHTTASHLIEHTHTHRAILYQHRNRRKCSPSHTSGSANGQALVTLLTVPGMYDIHIAFGQYLERNMKQTTQLLNQSIMF